MTRRTVQLRRQPMMPTMMKLRTPSACLALLVLLAVTPRAGAQSVEVAIGTASGLPGGTADVTFTLTDPTGTAVGAGLDVLFPAGTLGALSITPSTDCTLAPRLGNTYMLGALPLNLPPGGQGFGLEVGLSNPNAQISPIGTGDLATCTFHIPGTAQVGTTVTLTADMVLVSATSNGHVQILPSTGVNGEVAIVSVVPGTSTPTGTVVVNTPTPTLTQGVATATKTNTPVSTNTNTPVPPTNTPVPPTKTKTPGAAPTNTGSAALRTGGGGGCTIAAAESGPISSCLWLVIPAALLMRRRRTSR